MPYQARSGDPCTGLGVFQTKLRSHAGNNCRYLLSAMFTVIYGTCVVLSSGVVRACCCCWRVLLLLARRGVRACCCWRAVVFARVSVVFARVSVVFARVVVGALACVCAGVRLLWHLQLVARMLCRTIAVWSAAGSSGCCPLPVAVQMYRGRSNSDSSSRESSQK